MIVISSTFAKIKGCELLWWSPYFTYSDGHKDCSFKFVCDTHFSKEDAEKYSKSFENNKYALKF